jgi:CubicO group peptidase (beta-lactamase class C family)
VSPLLASADRLVEEGVATRAFPGGVLAVGNSRGLVHLRPYGRLTYEPGSPRVSVDTLYDVASLTKVVATSIVAMRLVEEGRLDIDAPVSAYLPACLGDEGQASVRVSDLLAHSSGLPAWAPLFREVRGKAAVVKRVCGLDLDSPPGSRFQYGDLGFIVLGEVLEAAGGAALDILASRLVFEPLGMRDTFYRPGPEEVERVAPTEEDGWRGRVLKGEVQDPNAYAMGGVAPHAGLFSTAGDVARVAEMLLGRGTFRGERLLSPETVERFTTRVSVPDSTRTLGWETPAGDAWSGRRWSRRAYGHTGLTGTVLWIDPERDVFLVLLTNRIHPRRENEAWRDVRRRLSDAVVEATDSARQGPRPAGH